MKLIVLAVILAIAAVVFVIVKGIRQSNEETAGAMLAKAEDLSELQSVVKNHDKTAAAFSAKVLLAEKQWEDGQQDDAVATLRAFVESDRDHPARPSAEASLAAKLWSQGKSDEAAVLFRDLTEDPDSRFLAPYAWISLGDIAASKGDSEEAEKAYETVEAEFSQSTFSQVALTRRLLMKAEPPVEVSPPIEVPEANLIAPDTEEPTFEDSSVDDLLNAVKDGGSGGISNPLLDDSTPPEGSE